MRMAVRVTGRSSQYLEGEVAERSVSLSIFVFKNGPWVRGHIGVAALQVPGFCFRDFLVIKNTSDGAQFIELAAL